MDKAMAALIADKKLSELSEKLGIKKVELKIDKSQRPDYCKGYYKRVWCERARASN